jgi:hypothetical protein
MSSGKGCGSKKTFFKEKVGSRRGCGLRKKHSLGRKCVLGEMEGEKTFPKEKVGWGRIWGWGDDMDQKEVESLGMGND